MACGKITDPVPGDFYPVSNIDDMLFAFDALNPDPGTTQQGPVCQLQVCPEARHNFVLDRSIKSVNILGSGGVAGVVPYLISPSGKTLELPKKDGRNTADIDGVPVTYEWQSESAQTISLQNTGGPQWAGQWAIVYVDTTGQHPDAVSKVSIHITTDIFPALTGADKVSWRSGQVLKGLTFGLVDGQGKPMQPTDLAGTATMSAALVPDGAAPIPLLAVGRQGRHHQTGRRRPDEGEPGPCGAANVVGDHHRTGDRPVRRADRTRYRAVTPGRRCARADPAQAGPAHTGRADRLRHRAGHQRRDRAAEHHRPGLRLDRRHRRRQSGSRARRHRHPAGHLHGQLRTELHEGAGRADRPAAGDAAHRPRRARRAERHRAGTRCGTGQSKRRAGRGGPVRRVADPAAEHHQLRAGAHRRAAAGAGHPAGAAVRVEVVGQQDPRHPDAGRADPGRGEQ